MNRCVFHSCSAKTSTIATKCYLQPVLTATVAHDSIDISLPNRVVERAKTNWMKFFDEVCMHTSTHLHIALLICYTVIFHECKFVLVTKHTSVGMVAYALLQTFATQCD